MNPVARVQPQEAQFIQAPLSGAWQLIYPSFSHSIFMIRIVNDTDGPITVSYNNGTTVHDYAASGETIQIYFQANAQPNYIQANLAQGTSVSIRGGGANGTVACTGYSSYR